MWAMIPFKKELLILILSALAIYIFAQVWYNKGVDETEAKYAKLNYEQQIRDLNTKLESEKANVKVVTVYKEKIVEIEKKVPVYVTKVKEIFAYHDDIVIPPSLARLHNVSAENGNPDAFNPRDIDGTTARPVTLGEFAERVFENYSICHANSEQLVGFQDWAKEQMRLYPSKK